MRKMIDSLDRLTENNFQNFCSVLLSAAVPGFQAVDGSGGDGGDDGHHVDGQTLFQAYGPKSREYGKVASKIDQSLILAMKLKKTKFPNLRSFVFLTNFDLTPQMHAHLQSEASKHGLAGESWGASALLSKLANNPGIRASFSEFLLPDVVGEIRGVRDAIAETRSAETLPRFEGELFPEQAGTFIKFLEQNAHRVVFLNLWFDSDSKLITSHDSGFSIRTDEPNDSPQCGWSYEVHANPNVPESGFRYHRGTYKLVGYFVVSGFDGPYQGFMVVGLRVIPPESLPNAFK